MSLTLNTSEWLGFLCLAGVFAAMYRIPKASRPDILAAFIVLLLGSFFREAIVHVYGMGFWTETAVLLSGLARIVQIIGAAMFIRATIKDKCGEWGWIVVMIATAMLALLV